MRILLAYPPLVSPWSPYLSLPSLAAYLQAHGLHDVAVTDLNLDFFEDFTEPRTRPRGVADPGHQVDWEAVSRAKVLLRSGKQPLEEAELLASLQQLDSAFATSSRRFGSTRLRYVGAKKLPRHPQALLFPYGPTVPSLEMDYPPTSSLAIRAAVDDRAQNPFLDYYERALVGSLSAMRPDVVGVSVAFPSQMIPAFSFARFVKKLLPACHVTMGGAHISKLRVNLKQSVAFQELLLPLVDSVVIGEGEGALVQLIQTLDRGEETAASPNLVFRRGRRVTITAPAPALHVADLPTPDFSQLDLPRYLGSGTCRTVPLLCTRGCYWGKCTFCDSFMLLGNYRARPTRRLLADVEALHRLHDVRGIQFADEALPPAVMRALSSFITERGLPVQWSSYARFERGMTADFCQQIAAGGCRVLFMGLESASRRVNDLMDKGVDCDRIADILRNLHAAGIGAHIFSIVGFPGETVEDARRTCDFLLENRKHYLSYSLVPFILENDSIAGAEPHRFGISNIEVDDQHDLETGHAYVPDTGLTMQEAAELYESFNQELASAGAYNPIFV